MAQHAGPATAAKVQTIRTVEAERETGVSRFDLYRAARERLAPPGSFFYVGKALFWRRAALLAWLANGGSRFPGGWRREPVETA